MKKIIVPSFIIFELDGDLVDVLDDGHSTEYSSKFVTEGLLPEELSGCPNLTS